MSGRLAGRVAFITGAARGRRGAHRDQQGIAPTVWRS